MKIFVSETLGVGNWIRFSQNDASWEFEELGDLGVSRGMNGVTLN